MDLGLIIGQAAGFALLIFAIAIGGAGFLPYINIPSVFIVIGGTLATMMMAEGVGGFQRLIQLWQVAVRVSSDNPGQIIDSLVTFSEKARREGLLALEDDMDSVDDVFLRKGMQLVVDGTDPELVRKVMQTELDSINQRHNAGKGVFDNMGSLAPAFGMIGTLVGLIAMLSNLSDPDAIGAGMSAALITTLYGSVMANAVFIPTANKLGNLHEQEVLIKEIMIEGTISIQSGDNPGIVKEKLMSFLSPQVRKGLEGEGDRE